MYKRNKKVNNDKEVNIFEKFESLFNEKTAL
jgi:hypothetical protein